VALPGDKLTLTVVVELAFTVTAAVTLNAVFAALVAVMVTLVEEVTAGAVNKPVLEIVPLLVDHVTAVLLVPRTVAANC
jgi:hypothetical protein